MLCMDAGGPNKGLFNLLCHSSSRKHQLLTVGEISFQNPYHPDRIVIFVFCTTHGLKAVRNAMFNSKKEKSVRNLMNSNDEHLYWDHFRSWRENDEKLISNTDLSIDSVYLNKWSKMNVRLAKQPFSFKTRTAILTNLSSRLGVIHQVHKLRGTTE